MNRTSVAVFLLSYAKMSATCSAKWITPAVYPHNDNMKQNTNCAHTPIKTHCFPLMKNKRIKFCLFSEHTICITALSKENKRASVCENNLSPFFMSISISVGALLEWKFLNGAHSFHSSASRGNRARNSSALPIWVTAVMYPTGGSPMSNFTFWHLNITQTECNSQLQIE